MDFKAEGLKILMYVFSCQSSSFLDYRLHLYDDCFHEWKIIPLHLLGKYFSSSFKFSSNLDFGSKFLEEFSSFDERMIKNWQKYFIAPSITPSCILIQNLRYSSYIKTDSRSVELKLFLNKEYQFHY